MENETQNQDTQAAPQQQPVVEEAQAAPPQQAMDDTQAATSEVHDDPGIPQQEEQHQGIAVGEPDPGSPGGEPLSEDALGIGIEDISADPMNPPDFPWDETNYGDAGPPSLSDLFGNDVISPTVSDDSLGSWGSTSSDRIEEMPSLVETTENVGTTENYEEMPNLEATTENTPEYLEQQEQKIWDWWDSEPSDTETVSMPTDKIEDPVPADQAQPPDSEAAAPLSPEAVSMPIDKIVKPVPTDQGQELPGDSGEEGMIDPDPDVYGPGITPDESYEILKDWYQGDYDGSGIAGGLDLDQDGMPENTGINPHVQPDFPGNDPAGQHEADVIPDEAGINPDTSEGEGYTYDEDAYEDAEDAMKDLRHALKHGDEEDRAEALQKLQGYLGGFDKGAAEDEENDPHNHGDPKEVANAVDKEPEDAPDASGAAVSGPAVGAAGAAVDEAKGLDQDGTETQDNQILSGSDYYDGAFGTMGDTDGDGVLNGEDSDWDIFDRDGDGKEDYLVLDADDDGIVDVKEDADGDGIVDVQDVDADNDGTDDWLVSDLDGDGIEYGKEDSDGDGIENAKDDSDGDGMLDWKDSDSDGNGIDDWEEIFSDPYEFDCFPGEDPYDYSW